MKNVILSNACLKTKFNFTPPRLFLLKIWQYSHFFTRLALVILMSTFFMTAGFGQVIGCDEIELHFGVAEENDCYEHVVPIWFEYVENGAINPAPTAFSFCYHFPEAGEDVYEDGNFQINGNIENGTIIGFNVIDNSFFTINTIYDVDVGDYFRIEIGHSTHNNVVEVNFGSEENPLLEIIVDVPPSQTFKLKNIEYLNGFALSDNGCNIYSGNCRPIILGPNVEISPASNPDFDQYSMEFEGSNITVSGCEFELFFPNGLAYYIDVDNITYSNVAVIGQNFAFVPVKISATSIPEGGQMELEHLDFDLTWTNEFDNLLINSILSTDIYSDLMNGVITTPTILDIDGSMHINIKPDIADGTFLIPFTSGDPTLFTMIIDAPEEPLAGGRLTFNFENSSVQMPADPANNTPALCCRIPAAADQVLTLDNYTFPCIFEDGEDEDFSVEVGVRENENLCLMPSIPLHLKGNQEIYDLKITGVILEIDMTFMGGDIQIDIAATENNLQNFGVGSLVQVTATSILINTSTYYLQPGFSQDPTLPWFDIILMGEGSVSDFWVKQAEFTYDLYTAADSYETKSCVVAVMEEDGTTGDIDVAVCSGAHGQITRIDNVTGVEDVRICVSLVDIDEDPCVADPGACVEMLTSNTDGEVSTDFCNGDPTKRYAFKATKFTLGADDAYCGVSTFDIITLRKHILGVVDLLDPDLEGADQWRLFVADINGDGDISSFDIFLLQKSILGINPPLPWKFAPCDYNWATDFVPGDASSYPSNCIEAENPCDVCFNAFKIGDVNNSGCEDVMNIEKPDDVLYLSLIDKGINADGKYEVGFQPMADFTFITGFQMALESDAQKMAPHTWKEEDIAGLSSDNFHTDNGVTKVVWVDPSGIGKTLLEDKRIFGQDYTLLLPTASDVNDIILRNDILPARAYRFDGKIYEIRLIKKGGNSGPKNLVPSTTKNPQNIHVYTGKQGPFVKFSAIKNEIGVLTVFDIQGKRIKQIAVDIQKGINSFEFNADTWAKGIYIIHLQLPSAQYTKKWVNN